LAGRSSITSLIEEFSDRFSDFMTKEIYNKNVSFPIFNGIKMPQQQTYNWNLSVYRVIQHYKKNVMTHHLLIFIQNRFPPPKNILISENMLC
jgi:hypothetical protein